MMIFIILHLLVWSFSIFSLLVWLSKLNPMRFFTPFGIAMSIAGRIIGLKLIALVVLAFALFRSQST
jgi:hypothetical protein